jgi:hypothetical protein
MAKKTINIGQTTNDKSGDPLRTAFGKVNDNFTELYNAISVDIQIPSVTGNDGKVLATDGIGLAWAAIPTHSSLVSGDATFTINSSGILTLPVGGDIVDSNGVSVLGTTLGSWTKTAAGSIANGVATVVWASSYDYISSAKLIIQIECNEALDASGWHSQACEAIIASRGYASGISGFGDPDMAVYGVINTSVDPLVTFTVQRNTLTRLIEVVATTTATADGAAQYRIHSVEMATRD